MYFNIAHAVDQLFQRIYGIAVLEIDIMVSWDYMHNPARVGYRFEEVHTHPISSIDVYILPAIHDITEMTDFLDVMGVEVGEKDVVEESFFIIKES